MWAAACCSAGVADSPQTEQMMTMSASQQQQQQRVRWVWPRSETCGRSFKGRREPREGREKSPAGHEPNLCELSQTMTSTRNPQVLSGALDRLRGFFFCCRKVRKNHIFVVYASDLGLEVLQSEKVPTAFSRSPSEKIEGLRV